MSTPYEGFQDLVAQVPEFVQPLLIALAGAVPYIEGEGSAALGVIAGLNPIVAGIAGASGNILCVILVVLLSSRIRTAVIARKAQRATPVRAAGTYPDVAPSQATHGTGATTATATQLQGTDEHTVELPAESGPAQSKGRQKLNRWIIKFGVPGASLLAPIALPTQLTAATLVASGVNKGWVILWQVIAIVLWTTAVTAAATGVITVITG